MTNESPRINHRWQCPECDNAITLHVRIQHPPICNNKMVHSRRRIEMKHDKAGRRRSSHEQS